MRFLDQYPSVLSVWRNGDREDNIEKGDGGGRLKLLRWHVQASLFKLCCDRNSCSCEIQFGKVADDSGTDQVLLYDSYLEFNTFLMNWQLIFLGSLKKILLCMCSFVSQCGDMSACCVYLGSLLQAESFPLLYPDFFLLL